MTGSRTLRPLRVLLSYPDDQTIEAAELLYVSLQSELPEAAKHISKFGAFLDQHDLCEAEEAFTGTFDVNPACAPEVGWHLFGEEYARGMFLVRMREQMRKFGIEETSELPDHITHVLSVIAAMPHSEAQRFVRACVEPAVRTMRRGIEEKPTPYRHVVACLDEVLSHFWGRGRSPSDDSEQSQQDEHAVSAGIDPLHAFPVAGIRPGCGSCGSGPEEFVQLENTFPPPPRDSQP